MSTLLTALGVGSTGAFYGYVLMYILRRCLPPVSRKAPALKDIALLLTALGFSGVIGATATLGRIDYAGLYGLGLLTGLAANAIFTAFAEALYYWAQFRYYTQEERMEREK